MIDKIIKLFKKEQYPRVYGLIFEDSGMYYISLNSGYTLEKVISKSRNEIIDKNPNIKKKDLKLAMWKSNDKGKSLFKNR